MAGILEVDDTGAAAEDRRYRVPPGHEEVLLDPDSLAYLIADGPRTPCPSPPFCRPSRRRSEPAAGSTGPHTEGRAWRRRRAPTGRCSSTCSAPSGSRPCRTCTSGCRPTRRRGRGRRLRRRLVEHRDRPRLPEGDRRRLRLDAASVELARENAAAAGLDDRVRFHLRDAGDPELSGRYDLVTVFEAIHDMSRPVEVLRALRSLAGDEGTVLVMDEKVADAFTAPGDEVERLMYTYSVLCCLPVGMAEQPSAATGTVMRTDTLRRYAQEAGFADVEVLPIEHDVFRFYRLS